MIDDAAEHVFVLGAGRAGRGLARALRASRIDVVGVHGRHAVAGAEPVSAGELPESLSRATTVLVTVRDAQIDAALGQLARSARLAPGAVVLHASGSADPEGLAALRAEGHPAGTIHPLVPLADPERAPATLRGAWIGIDGDALARAAAGRLAHALGASTVEIPAGEKARYHAAAVIASNFPAVLLSLAERVLADAGFAPDAARRMLHPLFMAAAENLRTRTGPEVLTGPIVRGDADTIRRHLDALRDEPDVLAAYRALTRAALPLAREAGTEGRGLEEIGRLLD
jgi:predicted short-subunit dehydrogenase-like oxidoreductase (DUF2520 family)